MSASEMIDAITERIATLQRTSFEGQIDLREKQRGLELQIDQIFLGLVDILDLLEPVDRKSADNASAQDTERMLRKASRRLRALLEGGGVTEISIANVKSNPGSIRVLESRGQSEVQLCRRGYTRGSRILRPAEVIT